jgi:hypothetical protein
MVRHLTIKKILVLIIGMNSFAFADDADRSCKVKTFQNVRVQNQLCAENLTVLDGANFQGLITGVNEALSGNLSVGGTTTIGGNLTVTGTVTSSSPASGLPAYAYAFSVLGAGLTIAAGGPVSFDTLAGAVGITEPTVTTFVLPTAGNYSVSFVITNTVALLSQFEITRNGVLVPGGLYGNAVNIGNAVAGQAIIFGAAAGDIISVISPQGVTLNVLGGGAVSASIIIEELS